MSGFFTRLRRYLLVAFATSSLVFGSCAKKSEEQSAGARAGAEGVPAGWKFTLPPGDPVEGKKLFVEFECYKCHEVKGESFPPPAEGGRELGPELSQMGGQHPVEFYAESIVSPNAVIDREDAKRGFAGADGRSNMPDYSDLLTVKQLADLAYYLATLKGEAHKGH